MEGARGRIRPSLVVVLLAAIMAAALIGYGVARRHAGEAEQSIRRGSAGSNGQRTITLKAGDDLQRALDAARPGDTLVLQAGATFVGPLTLPLKRGDEFVNVESSALDRLPPEGQRVSPTDAALMPKIVSPGRGEAALRTAAGAHHYRFIGVEFATKDEGALAYELLKLGQDDRTQDSLDKVPHHLVFDRCYIHALPTQSLKRGIALNSAETSIINSYVAGFKVVGQEAQAIAGWNGPGPFHIVNNYLEAAGENILFGGATAIIPGLVPTDIEVRRNHFAKDPAWYPQHPSYAGTHWSVKNLFELKNARRVRIEGNLFEYNWTDAQAGYAILFTPRPNDSGAAAVVEDIQFTNNVVRHVAAVFHIAGQDDLAQNPKAHLARRISITNNLFDEVDGERWGGDGALLKIGQSADFVTVDHNTVIHTGNITKAYGDPSLNFVFTNNLLAHNDYGIMGDSQSPGLKTIEAFFPGGVLRGNAIAGAESRLYPPGNFFPPSLDAVRFVNRAAGDYHLQPASPYRGRATDGKDVGCDFAALEAAGPLPGTRPRTVSQPR
ncbi:MAG: hypothetical protein QOH51_3608 [Acidobacteriota bacterium]|jgi:hypothetical protein|nr:hypothetical protein [Acidobacteriota bacterium]